MNNIETRSYQTETPVPLWHAWTNGPGSRPDRYSTRISRLLAFDVLLTHGDRLEDDQREFAETLLEDTELEVVLDGV